MSPWRLAPVLIFVALPLIELALLIKAGEVLGFWPTIMIILISAALGMIVIREQGLSMVGRMFSAMNEGRFPLEPLLDSYALIMAGLLLIIPGLLTDLIGLLLLVPPLRRLVIGWTLSGLAGRPETTVQAGGRRVRRPTIIEGNYERLDEQDVKPPEES